MKKITVALVCLSTLLLSLNVSAANRPHFNYVQLNFLEQDLGDFNCSQDGIELIGSLVYNDQTHLEAAISDVSGNGCGSEMTRIGAGLRSDFGSASRLYGTLSIIDIDTNSGNGDFGFGLEAGIRSFIDSGIETRAYFGYVDIDNGDGSYMGLSGVYWFSSSLSLVGDLTFNDNDDESLKIGIRFAY